MAEALQSGSGRMKTGKPPVAKWGAACSACAVAKSKCIRSNPEAGSKCDRCERLFKDCAGQLHRPRKKRQPKPSRTAQLEERLNGLVNILKASGELSKANLSSEQLDIQLRTPSTAVPNKLAVPKSQSPAPPQQSSEDDGDDSGKSNPWAIPAEYNACAPVSCICRLENGDAPPPPDSDDALLQIYRSELQPQHPFIVIPATVSAAALASERPFLMAAIRMATSFRSPRSMRAQMYHLMKEVSERSLIRSERSLDLLLGLEVMLGWYQYHCPVHAQLSNLVGLAKSLAGELGLGRPPKIVKERFTGPVTKYVEMGVRTNEERRALAGIWFLSSTTSLGYGKIEPMRFTRYLDQCLRDLEDATEYESDEQLVSLVRIQRLMERLAQLGEEGEPVEEVPALPTLPAPREALLSACRIELDRIQQGLPPRLKSDKIIQTYINTATLRLFEPPMVTRDLISAIAQSLHATENGPSPPLDGIYRSHAALTTWFDTWLSVPVSSYYCLTMATCVQVVYAISRLGRWARLVTFRASQPGGLSLEAEEKRLNEALDPSLASSSTPSGHSSTVSASASPAAPTPGSEASTERELCPYNPNRPDENTDPTLPVAVASVQSQLGKFPGLEIDIPQIMSSLQKRFQDVSTSIQRLSVPAEQKDLNAWSMNAIKLFLTRVKLEHWAELVAEGVEALSLSDGRPGIPISMSGTGVSSAAGMAMATEDALMSDLSRNLLMQEGFSQENTDMAYFYGGSTQGGGGGTSHPWVTDMMQNGDASTWFDGYLNWGSVDESGMMR